MLTSIYIVVHASSHQVNKQALKATNVFNVIFIHSFLQVTMLTLTI